jgi:sn-glycerol 3-phosphate transport system substrate-binding protein
VKSSGYDTSAFLATGLGAYATQGVQWSIPFNISNPVLFYNRKMFTAAGLDPDKPPVSLDDLRADSQAIVQSGAAKYGLALDAGFDSGGGWYIEQWFAKAGVDLCLRPERPQRPPRCSQQCRGPIAAHVDAVDDHRRVTVTVGDNAGGIDNC